MSRKTITIIIAVLVLITGASIIYGQFGSNYGYAVIDFEQQPNVNSFNATINSHPLNLTGVDSTYKLSDGNNTLTVTGSGYKKFSSSFLVQKNKTLYINVIMQSSAPTSSAQATQQLQGSLSSILPSGSTIQSSTYFYGNTWAVLVTQSPDGDSAVIVAKYDVVANEWFIALGPGTYFNSSDMSSLPSQVSSYMYQENYAVGGS